MTKPVPHVFKVKDVKAAARKAYKEKRLAAQQGEPCKYFADDKPIGSCVCAIGAAIPKRLAKKVQADGSNGYTLEDLLIAFPDNFKVASAKGRKILEQIQNAHDDWTHGHGTEKTFLATLK